MIPIIYARIQAIVPIEHEFVRKRVIKKFRVEPAVAQPPPPTDPDVSNLLIRFLGT